MQNNSIKVKYFKDSIVGLKATLTGCNRNRGYKNKKGRIKKDESGNRFTLVFEEPIKGNNRVIDSIQLDENDEIVLNEILITF